MSSGKFNRRRFIEGVAALPVAGWLSSVARASESANVESIRTISLDDAYHGWPTLLRRKSGELLLVYSGGREDHVCPFGRVELMRSHDDGRTWTWPQVIFDGPLDDRDAGILETAEGTLIVSTFTSLAYEPLLKDSTDWPAERRTRWEAARDRLSAAERKAGLGCWTLRSTDGGKTWSPPVNSLVNSPHGPMQLADGRLLYVGKTLWSATPEKIGASESTDDGRTWRWLSEIPTRPGDSVDEYHELHAVETADGGIVAAIRNHNAASRDETLLTESADGGRTWSVPRSSGVWGYPAHLLRLRDDRLLMSVGHRRAPLGNQVAVSGDHGRTWSTPVVVSGDGAGGDLGYPSTVELGDGALLTVWYEQLAGQPKAVLRLARWRLA
jgi:hypothetical protein